MRLLCVSICLFLAFPAFSQGDPEFVMTLPSGQIGTNVDEFSLLVGLSNDEPLVAMTFGVCHPAELATVDSVAETIASYEPDFFSEEILDDGFYVEILYEDSVFPVTSRWLVKATYSILGTAGDTVSLEFCDDLTDPPAAPTLINEDDEEVEPDTFDGEIEIIDEVTFLRGDVDGDGQFVGLLEAIFILEWGFAGGPAPPCREGADVDNSGEIFPLLDALEILYFTFGSTEPPDDPGPYECGPDPEPEEGLGCDGFEGPCPAYRRSP